MIKVVYDTNIIISANISSGLPRLAFKLALRKFVQLCVTEELLSEYKSVLLRPKFHNTTEDVDEIITMVRNCALIISPLTKKISKIKDIPDNLILECAVSAKAEYIVTGNVRHFDFEEYEGIKIVEPRDFFINLGLEKVLYFYEK